MKTYVWIVNEFTDVVESVWSSKDLAISRAAELDAANGCEDYSLIQAYLLDMPDGIV